MPEGTIPHGETAETFDYIVSGVGPRGRRTFERMAARTAVEAIALFRAKGFSDVKLHNDDTMRGLVPDSVQKKALKSYSAKDMSRLAERTASEHRWWLLVKCYRMMVLPMAIALVFIGVRRARLQPFGWVDFGAVWVLLVPGVVALWAGFSLGILQRIQRGGDEGALGSCALVTACTEEEGSGAGSGSGGSDGRRMAGQGARPAWASR